MEKFIKLFFMSLIMALQSFCQNIDISGKVADEAGNPIRGVSIRVKGKRIGTLSDSDGSFQIKGIPPNSTILFSGIGYENQEAVLNGANSLNIKMKTDAKALSEVVVTGVGVATSKKKVALDVGTINSKDVAKSAIASVEQALQGKIAGASVQFTSGLPGASAQIVLRGINDLGSTPPMILVDGVEVNGGLNGLDLSIVDRIEVIKGAAGGTLYGAQGANGVIQIFTKRGAKGRKPQIDIRTQLSIDQVIRQNQLTNNFHHFITDAEGFVIRSGTRLQPDVNGKWPDPVFSTAGLTGTSLANVKNDKAYKEQTYDHISQAYRQAVTHNTSLNISGGGEKADYSFAVSHLNQRNVLFNGYKRTNVSANLGFELFKGFTVRSSSQFILTNEDLLAGGGRFNLVNSWKFVDFNFRGPSGYLVVRPKQENQLNPLSEREWRNRSQKQNRLIQNVNLNYKFPKYLELDYKYGIEIWNNDLNDYFLNQRIAPQSAEAFWGGTVDGSISSRFNKFTYQNSIATAFLRFDLENDFKLKVPIRSTTQASYDWRNSQNRQFLARGTGLPTYPPYNINVAQTKDAQSFDDEFITYGVLINQTFDYGNLFGISGGIRSDFSSEFGDAANAFTFPRVTAYFRPSELLRINWLTDWKVRGAYGEAGIQPVDPNATVQPGRYARQVILDAATVGSGGVGLSLPTQARNPKLSVQRSKELEIGTDATFKVGKDKWVNRIIISATYWNRTSQDIIQPADVSPSTGFQATLDNLATLKSTGFDFSVDVDVLQDKNFTWNFGGRLGAFKVMVDKISNGKEVVTGFFGLREGQQLGVFNGMYPISNLNALRPDKTPYIAASNLQFYEIVNNTVVDKRTNRVLMSDANDQQVIGNAFPKFNASFINTFSLYNKFTLAFQIDWRAGNEIYNITRQWMYRDRIHADFDKPVTINGQTGAFVEYYNSLYNNVSPTSWFIEDGSFIRLRDLSITYSVGEKIKEKAKWLRAASITFAGRNLLTITKFSGLDPESTNTNDSQGNATIGLGVINGVDYFGVPNLKSFQLSLNLGF
jgi:TonB-dependent starch-binding outer membrane protein SusC